MDMQDTREQVTLTRAVDAALVPMGERVKLEAGQRATITQALGGSYTVVVGGNMFRIDGKDSDALGKQPLARQDKHSGTVASRDQVEQEAWEALQTCYDPEIPVNIVDLGLIYACEIEPMHDDADGGWRLHLQMTLTAPGCGMGDFLAHDVEQKLLAISGVEQVDVELVWEPPWSRERMTEAARLALGVF